MNKAELRTLYLQKREALPESIYLTSSSRICDHFFLSAELSFIKVLHTFLPVVEKREVDTWLVIDKIKREYPQIKLTIPKIDKKTDELSHYYFEGMNQLEENGWGIKEPKEGVLAQPTEIDLVLVPLLAFDIAGNRIGYGKGYYDRFLSNCRPDCKKIGVSLFPPTLKIDKNDFDVKLDYCITPEEVYSF